MGNSCGSGAERFRRFTDFREGAFEDFFLAAFFLLGAVTRCFIRSSFYIISSVDSLRTHFPCQTVAEIFNTIVEIGVENALDDCHCRLLMRG